MRKMAAAGAAMLLLAGCGIGGAAPATTAPSSAQSSTAISTPPGTSAASTIGSLEALRAAVEAKGGFVCSSWQKFEDMSEYLCDSPSLMLFWDPLADTDPSLMDSTKPVFALRYSTTGGAWAGTNWVVGAESPVFERLEALGGERVKA